jgi:hypothetical protein
MWLTHEINSERWELNMNKTIRFTGSALMAMGLLMQSGVAQSLTNLASDQQSIELGNVDGPEEASTPVSQAQEVQSVTGATREVISSGTNTNEQADNKISVGASAPEPVAATPMERYRDLKLQQATNAHVGNPSTIRRYLKVDRSAFADADGVK